MKLNEKVAYIFRRKVSCIALLLLSGITPVYANSVCSPSPIELQFGSIVQNLYNRPLWGKYPSQTRFAVADMAVGSPGFFITKTADEQQFLTSAGLIQNCGPDSQLNRFNIPLQKGAIGYYPNCSQIVADSSKICAPPLKSFYEHLGLPMGLEILDRARLAEIQTKLFGNGKKYSDIQLIVYNSFHEMFHNYQGEVEFLKKIKNGRSLAVEIYHDCVATKSAWSAKYEKERVWWSKNLRTIYDQKTSQRGLLAIAKTFIQTVRPSAEEFARCDEALAAYEQHEGTAHFVGDLALLDSGIIDSSDLAAIDSQYLKVSPEIHSVMYVYGTGGGLSMLLHRLAGSMWQGIAESGQTPYEILKNYINKWLPQVQVGSTWGRNPILNTNQISNKNLIHAASSVAEFNRGTAFYIGKHMGRHLMITNAHVVAGVENLPKQTEKFLGKSGCLDETGKVLTFKFAPAKIDFECSRVLKIVSALELALIEMTVPSEKENFLSSIGISLNKVNDKIDLNRQLVTFGYGQFMNPGLDNLNLMMISDSDCKVFSDPQQAKLIKDPDSRNDLHKVYSFVFGCDIVKGDSGSPIFEKDTGRWIGVVWGGKFPKANVADSKLLQAKSFWNSEDAWTQLNYAVPATSIINELAPFLAN